MTGSLGGAAGMQLEISKQTKKKITNYNNETEKMTVTDHFLPRKEDSRLRGGSGVADLL